MASRYGIDVSNISAELSGDKYWDEFYKIGQDKLEKDGIGEYFADGLFSEDAQDTIIDGF